MTASLRSRRLQLVYDRLVEACHDKILFPAVRLCVFEAMVAVNPGSPRLCKSKFSRQLAWSVLMATPLPNNQSVCQQGCASAASAMQGDAIQSQWSGGPAATAWSRPCRL